MSIQEELATSIAHELDRLAKEVRAYEDPDDLWRVHGDQKHMPGNVVLHLCANLLHYIGAELGGSEEVRHGPEVGAHLTQQELLDRIGETRRIVTEILMAVPDEVMAGPFPGAVPEPLHGIRTVPFLTKVIGHFRSIRESSPGLAGRVPPPSEYGS